MGRRPSTPNAVPRLRLRKRGRLTYYFYDHGGSPRREESLGTDYGLAILKWAAYENSRNTAKVVAEVITFRHVADRYMAEMLPKKAPRTQADNIKELAKLKEFFDDPPGPFEGIQPQHVVAYMAWRSKTAKIRANREKALLSHIWNWARGEGYTALANPCRGIKGNKEEGRGVYIEDDEFQAVYAHASLPLRDAMDLAYLTGQRVSDTLKMDERDLRDGSLNVRQGKTDAKLRLEVIGELAALVERIKARKSGMVVRATRLIVDGHGRPMSYTSLYNAFRAARGKAGIKAMDFQFRDLRAKAGTDKADATGDIRQAQAQLGHKNVGMTEHYVKRTRGSKVTPTR